MSEFPIRMSATLEGESVLIKALLTHPMTTEQDTEDGRTHLAHHLTEVDLLLNGVLVARVHTRTGISTDPLFGWRVAGVHPGDRITLIWRDNRGWTESAETTAR